MKQSDDKEESEAKVWTIEVSEPTRMKIKNLGDDERVFHSPAHKYIVTVVLLNYTQYDFYSFDKLKRMR